MKKISLAFLQFVLFLLIFLAGSFLRPIHLTWSVTHPTPTSTRYFVPDGLLLMLALYITILVIEVITKRIRTAGLWTTAAFLLALVVGLMAKFGSVTQDMF